jgi:hypothetical protein
MVFVPVTNNFQINPLSEYTTRRSGYGDETRNDVVVPQLTAPVVSVLMLVSHGSKVIVSNIHVM